MSSKLDLEGYMVIHSYKSGVSKIGPMGQIQPADPYNLAHGTPCGSQSGPTHCMQHVLALALHVELGCHMLWTGWSWYAHCMQGWSRVCAIRSTWGWSGACDMCGTLAGLALVPVLGPACGAGLWAQSLI